MDVYVGLLLRLSPAACQVASPEHHPTDRLVGGSLLNAKCKLQDADVPWQAGAAGPAYNVIDTCKLRR